MSQNRPELIKKFIGIASNTITHRILLRTELEEDIRKYYNKEIERDIDIALKYRNMINRVDNTLPEKDAEEIKDKIVLKVRAELLKRINKGYNIDISLIEVEVDKFLKEHKVD